MRLVCVCPNPAIDHTVVVPALATGETVRASRSVTTAGGKGLNVARFSQGFGAQVVAVTWLGEVGADHMRALARRDGLHLKATVVPGATVRVCPVLVDSRDGTVLTTSDPPAVLSPMDWSEFTRIVAEATAEADVVCVAGSFPRVRETEAVDALLDAIGSTTPVWFDSSGPALARAAAGFPDVGLKINLAEARALLGAERSDVGECVGETWGEEWREVLEAANTLGRGIRSIIVTAGAAGAAEATPRRRRWRDAPRVPVLNPTGSGDAFLAAYLCAGRGRLSQLRDPLEAGVLAGAVNASSWEPAVTPDSIVELATSA